MKPGHGEVLIAEGDVEIAEQERELLAEAAEGLGGSLGHRRDRSPGRSGV